MICRKYLDNFLAFFLAGKLYFSYFGLSVPVVDPYLLILSS